MPIEIDPRAGRPPAPQPPGLTAAHRLQPIEAAPAVMAPPDQVTRGGWALRTEGAALPMLGFIPDPGALMYQLQFLGAGRRAKAGPPPPTEDELGQEVTEALSETPAWRHWQELTARATEAAEELRRLDREIARCGQERVAGLQCASSVAILSGLAHRQGELAGQRRATAEAAASIEQALAAAAREVATQAAEVVARAWDRRPRGRSRAEVLAELAGVCGPLLEELAGVPLSPPAAPVGYVLQSMGLPGEGR